MTSILFLIETIYNNIFRRNYLRNEKHFLNFFQYFQNLDAIFNIFKQKMTVRADVFLKLRPRKTWLEIFLKSQISVDPSSGNMVNGLKQCSKDTNNSTNDSTFTIFINPCEGKSKATQVEKVSPSDMQHHRTVC